MDVGVKELRDTLSRRLREVKAGHVVTVTEHGRAVARIVPVDGPSTLERLVAEGRVTLPLQPDRDLPEPVAAEGTVSDLVIEQRR